MSKRRAHRQKSEKIKVERGFSPEEVIEAGELIAVLGHKFNPTQKLEVYKFSNYAWVVVVEGERLVSAWPSRKLKRQFGI